jgi:integrase
MAGKRRRRGWGQGTVRKRGQSWSICWRENGRRHFSSAPDEDTAKRMLSKILSDIALGQVGLRPSATGGPTLGELADPWLARRRNTHRAWRDDSSRWKCHLSPFFGHLRPHEVDGARMRQFVEERLSAGLAASSVGHCVRLLSTFFSDLVESGHATANPIASLPRKTRALFRSTYDTKRTPYLERLEDVRRIFAALPEPTNVCFACGVFLGLRTGEALGLRWQDLDLDARLAHLTQQIQHNQPGPLKDNEGRTVPIPDSLVPILREWKLKTGGDGLLFRPREGTGGGAPNTPPTYLRPETLRGHLAKALDKLSLPKLTWYHATRHTFASHWVLRGGSIATLREVMGHSSVTTTERYAHLSPSKYSDAVRNTVSVDMTPPKGDVVSISPRESQTVAEVPATTATA